MKKHYLAACLALASVPALSAEPSNLAALCYAEQLVEEGSLETAKNILPVYSTSLNMTGRILSIVNIEKAGQHRFEIRFVDKNNKIFDRCTFKPTHVKSTPFIQTLSCSTNGKWPAGGVHLNVYGTFKGQTKKLGGITLADWTSKM